MVTLALATANATASGWGMPGSSAPVEVLTVDVTARNARAPEFRFEIAYHAGWAAQEGRQRGWVLAGLLARTCVAGRRPPRLSTKWTRTR